MQLSSLIRRAKISLAAVAILAISGPVGGAHADGLFGLFDNFDLGDFFTYHGSKGKAPQAPRLSCPDILILDGTAASQVHAGTPPTNMNLRYQFSLGDVARECSIEGDQLAIKVGIAGKVLLGPVGTPASFSVPLRVAIISKIDHEAAVSKLYHVAATIPAGQSEADFKLVSEPLLVPFIKYRADADYEIKVGIDEGPPKPEAKSEEKTRR